MPNRILREGILDSDAVNSLSFMAELFYRRLMSVADDFGLCDGRPNWLRTRVFPLKSDQVTIEQICEWVEECCSTNPPLLNAYTVESKRYLRIENFGQRVYDSTKPKFPIPSPGSELQVRPPQPAVTRGSPPQPAVTRGSPPQPAARAHTRSESESESNAYSYANANAESGGGVRANEEPRPEAGPRLLNPTESPPAYWSERLYSRHPKKKNLPLVQSFCVDLFANSPPGEAASLLGVIDEVHALWCLEDDWTKENARYCPPLDQWLVDRGYERRPIRDPPKPERISVGRSAAFSVAARMREEAEPG